MLSAILVQTSSSVATVAKTVRAGVRIAWLPPVVVSPVATGCASISKRPDLVIETAELAPGDAAFARQMALRRGQVWPAHAGITWRASSARGSALTFGECLFPQAANDGATCGATNPSPHNRKGKCHEQDIGRSF